MTSSFAHNFVFDQLGRQNYLRVNKEGQPLQGQVPLTYQVYTGNGNETIAYEGANVLVIDSALPSGDLTVEIDPMRDFLGRIMTFVVPTQLQHNVTMDFGSGWLYVPPIPTPFHSTTLPKEISPAVGQMVFYDVDKASVLTQTVVFPERILPGGPGQVLTTNAGTGVVDWEDPAAQISPPKVLTFKWSASAANDLNQNTPHLVQWTIDAGNNDTTLTLGNGAGPGLCGDFTVPTDGPISICYDAFIVSDPTIAYRGLIAINSTQYSFSESSLGLTGQKLSGSLTYKATAGDIIGVYIGNAAGSITPVQPADAAYGNVSITQYVY